METSDGKSQGDFFASHQAQTQVSTPSSSSPHLFFVVALVHPYLKHEKNFFKQHSVSFSTAKNSKNFKNKTIFAFTLVL
jgi:hypothetical protein